MGKYTWGTPEHLEWLDDHRKRLVDFYQPNVVDPAGGYFWLGDDASPKPEQGKGLWIAARMVHCFSLLHLLGRDGALDVARHGVEYLLGQGRDAEFGGWFSQVNSDGCNDAKELYGIAHVILASSSAITAGIEPAQALLDEALRLIDEHYWIEADGAGIDEFDRAFTTADPYRGLNANMHLTEAFLAAYEATGDERLFDRVLRLAERFAKGQLESGRPAAHRLVEHFDEQWQPVPEYNRDEPAHPFRPYGSTPGHWLEWAKLCVQIAGIRPDIEWLIPAAEELFQGAVADAWLPGGGFAYTVDWDGKSVISNRFFWGVAEAIGAAHVLHLATSKPEYATWYERLWTFADEHLVDHERGSWFSELDDDLQPTKRTWDGKPDLYHVLQATLYAQMPLNEGLAKHLARR
ncbi:AGE family epimerase/isomerase [uncultured Tessaracoccus sp.]|uniref:AGE family epimerase/isomerase n=1 Tax=uncultured Tessaracoccus sp. TaxID=905023 RepID=UPI00260D20B4|nr:AGE family epimerase/isomerase [uncultured Tessaracoccus sp.]